MGRVPGWLKGLAAAVGVLGAAVLFSMIPWRGNGAKFQAPVEPVKFHVVSSRLSVTLEREADSWRVTDPVAWPADPEAAGRLTSGFNSFVLESEVTRRPESYSQYEVDDEKGLRLESWGRGDADPFVVVLGKNAGYSGRCYARVGSEPAVYLASGLSRDAADLPLPRWRDRRVLDRTDFESVRVTRGQQVFELKRSTDGWTLNGTAAGEDKASSFLSSLRTLSAEDFADPSPSMDLKKYGLDAPSSSFEVAFSTGAPVSFFLGTGDPLPLRKNGVESFFLIPSYRASALKTLLDEFFAPKQK